MAFKRRRLSQKSPDPGLLSLDVLSLLPTAGLLHSQALVKVGMTCQSLQKPFLLVERALNEKLVSAVTNSDRSNVLRLLPEGAHPDAESEDDGWPTGLFAADEIMSTGSTQATSVLVLLLAHGATAFMGNKKKNCHSLDTVIFSEFDNAAGDEDYSVILQRAESLLGLLTGHALVDRGRCCQGLLTGMDVENLEYRIDQEADVPAQMRHVLSAFKRERASLMMALEH
eukprot:TRINITY_DN81820_c0_g1_i1.p1 TRINITY_DN81820_c0_g1~~TRINITY_DN81820_c0_g1_i1.p1  ORF type:complete len:227 (-),score=32.63 TRINITY_DN81820_c0_g1_i1:97-777(-)